MQFGSGKVTGYDLTREDIENLALAMKAITTFEKRFDKIEDLLTNDNTRCAACKKETTSSIQAISAKVDVEIDRVDAKIQGINDVHTFQKGLTKGQAVGYGSIPTIVLGIILAALQLIPK